MQRPSNALSASQCWRTQKPSGFTRREAIKRAAGVVSAAVLSQMPQNAAANSSPLAVPKQQDPNVSHAPALTVATCQFPISADCALNARYIRSFMHQAAAKGAHLLHTSEACLTGYGGEDVPSFDKYDWNGLRGHTQELRELAKSLHLWLVLGSAHFLDQNSKPTNCLYLIDPQGEIVNRYDKCFLTGDDRQVYSAGDRLVTHDIRGVKIGLAICYDMCYPQLYIAYREAGAEVMLHSFNNAGDRDRDCEATLVVRQAATRCADNRLWAVCNNSSKPYSQWGAFIARPDATIPKQLPINEPGMLIHHFPDGLSKNGWFHCNYPMKKRDDEIMFLGTPVPHPRRLNGQSEA